MKLSRKVIEMLPMGLVVSIKASLANQNERIGILVQEMLASSSLSGYFERIGWEHIGILHRHTSKH